MSVLHCHVDMSTVPELVVYIWCHSCRSSFPCTWRCKNKNRTSVSAVEKVLTQILTYRLSWNSRAFIQPQCQAELIHCRCLLMTSLLRNRHQLVTVDRIRDPWNSLVPTCLHVQDVRAGRVGLMSLQNLLWSSDLKYWRTLFKRAYWTCFKAD